MSRPRGTRLLVVGGSLLALGSGPLLLVIVAAKLGLTRDPDPNPIGWGLLALVTFWPGVLCVLVGLVQRWRGAGRDT